MSELLDEEMEPVREHFSYLEQKIKDLEYECDRKNKQAKLFLEQRENVLWPIKKAAIELGYVDNNTETDVDYLIRVARERKEQVVTLPSEKHIHGVKK